MEANAAAMEEEIWKRGSSTKNARSAVLFPGSQGFGMPSVLARNQAAAPPSTEGTTIYVHEGPPKVGSSLLQTSPQATKQQEQLSQPSQPQPSLLQAAQQQQPQVSAQPQPQPQPQPQLTPNLPSGVGGEGSSGDESSSSSALNSFPADGTSFETDTALFMMGDQQQSSDQSPSPSLSPNAHADSITASQNALPSSGESDNSNSQAPVRGPQRDSNGDVLIPVSESVRLDTTSLPALLQQQQQQQQLSQPQQQQQQQAPPRQRAKSLEAMLKTPVDPILQAVGAPELPPLPAFPDASTKRNPSPGGLFA